MAGQITPTAVHNPILEEFCHGVANLKETISGVWNISPCIGCFRNGAPFLSEVVLQKGEKHLPALSKEAIPTCSAGEEASRWKRDGEALGPSNSSGFSHDFKPKRLVNEQ